MRNAELGCGDERARRFWLWHNCLPSARAWPSVSGSLCSRFMPGVAILSRLCPRFTHGITVLAQLFAFGTRPGLAFLLGRFAPAHACLFPPREKKRLAILLRSYSAGSRSPSSVLAVLARLSDIAGALRVCAFICGDLDGEPGMGLPGTRGTEDGERRGACASLRGHIGFAAFSAGNTLGLNVEAALRPPQTAPKSRM